MSSKKQLIIWLSSFASIGFLAVAVWITYGTVNATFAYRYPSLYWDQWDIFRSYIDYCNADQFRQWLFLPHNGHRIAFGKLLFLADLKWFGASNFMPMVLMLLGQAGLVTLLLASAWRHLQGWPARISLCSVVSALLFSATQLENFTWSLQVTFTSVFVLAGFSFACAHQSFQSPRWGSLWFLLSSIFAVLASFSVANGVLVWPLLAGYFFLRKRWFSVAFHLLVFVTIIKWYYVGGESTVSTVSFRALLDLKFLQFFLLYLGNPLGKHAFILSYIYGTAILLFLVLLLHSYWKHLRRADPLAWVGTTPVLLSLFILLSGLMTSVARMDRGLINATSERYNTAALILLGSLLVYAFMLLQQNRNKWFRCFVIGLMFAPLGYFYYLLMTQKFYIIQFGNQYQKKMMALEAIRNTSKDGFFLGLLYPNIGLHRHTINDLKRHPATQSVHASPGDTWGSLPIPSDRPKQHIQAEILKLPDLDGAPTRCIVFGSILWDQRHGNSPLIFTNSKGQVIGSGRTVRSLPNLIPFQSAAKPDDHHSWFYGYADLDQWQDALSIWRIESKNNWIEVASIQTAVTNTLTLATLETFRLENLSPIPFEVVSNDANWTPNGVFPGTPTATGLHSIWGSWSGNERYTGTISMRVWLEGHETMLYFPYLSGSSTPNVTIKLVFEDSELPYRQLFLPASVEKWRLIPFETFHWNGWATIEVSELGDGWGQWCAIAAPYVK